MTALGSKREVQTGPLRSGSITGMMGNKPLPDYSLTKGGIHAFTRWLAAHLPPRGNRVKAVALGPVWTRLNPSDHKDISGELSNATRRCSSTLRAGEAYG
jgi:NAD(P)-dependent dehydrogenase (short-subunit alcohol dehydrogenase family)